MQSCTVALFHTGAASIALKLPTSSSSLGLTNSRSMAAQLRKIPPFTRYTIFGVLGATLPTLLHLVSPYHLAFVPHRIAQNWELQRLVLPFLFGGGGLNLVFSLIMLYRSLNELEEGHFQRRLADISACGSLSACEARSDLFCAAWAFILICGMIIVRRAYRDERTGLTSLVPQGLNTPLQTPFLFNPFMMAVIHLVRPREDP